jgi:DHA1 family bicyclomycin/chloramphenicol resistance-like MFS transporter
MNELKVKRIQERHQGFATLLAFATIPISGFATDIYLPSLPSMAAHLQVSSVAVQTTLSLFLISYGVSQLLVGSLLDSFGRYKITLVSLIIFVLASIGVATSHNIYVIYLMRIIHGLTVGAIVVAKRAYFIDLFTGLELKKHLSSFTIVWSTGPIVAPFVGGYLQTAFGWQSNFYMLAIWGALLTIFELMIGGETIKQFSEFRLKKIITIYSEMLKDSVFVGAIVLLGLAYSMVMVYNMTGPFILEHHLGLSPIIVGYSSLILGFAWMTGGFLGKATIQYPFAKKMSANLVAQVLLVLAMMVAMHFVGNVFSVIFFAFLIHVAAGYTFNNYFTFCLSRFPNNAGISSGLTGGGSYVVVSFLSYGIISLVPAKDGLNLSYSYLILVLLSLVTLIFTLKDRPTHP